MSIRSANLVVNGDKPHSGAWVKGVALLVALEQPIPASDLPDLDDTGDAGRFGPLLAITRSGAHAEFSGLWTILSIDTNRKVVRCLVPTYEGDRYAAKVSYNVEAPPTRSGRNLIVGRPPATVDLTAQTIACMAPPLTFYAQKSVFGIDQIDTIGQTFRADSYLELRLRAISREQDEELVGALLDAYGFQSNMLELLNVVESVRNPEVWTAFGSTYPGCMY